MSRNLVLRIAFAVPAIAVTVLMLWLGGWALATLVAVLGVLGTREIYDFARKTGIEPLERLGLAGAAAFPFVTFWVKGHADWQPVRLGAARVHRGHPPRPAQRRAPARLDRPRTAAPRRHVGVRHLRHGGGEPARRAEAHARAVAPEDVGRSRRRGRDGAHLRAPAARAVRRAA